MKIIQFLLLFTTLVLFIGCQNQTRLGTKTNPIKMYFVPSVETGKILSDGETITKLLHAETGYFFEVAVPISYGAVIEALGTDEADIVWLPPFAYILANKLYDAQVGLTTIRNGLKQYRGQFLARADSKIDSLSDVKGKTVAYTDAASTSGYIYPSAILKQKGISPAKTFFAGGHPQAIISVYQGTADVACTFWSPKRGEEIHDARMHVQDTYPDVVDKIKIFAFSDWIPNDTVTFNKNLPKKIQKNIMDALIKIVHTKAGKKIFKDTYDIDGFIKSEDSDYDIVRNKLETLHLDANNFIE